jgi:hypothetical protein
LVFVNESALNILKPKLHPMIVLIKYMYHPACIYVVKGILKDLHKVYKSVYMGFALIASDFEAGQREAFNSKLKESGMEIKQTIFSIEVENILKGIEKMLRLAMDGQLILPSSPPKKFVFSEQLKKIMDIEYDKLADQFRHPMPMPLKRYFLRQKAKLAMRLLLNGMHEGDICDLLFYSGKEEIWKHIKRYTGKTPEQNKNAVAKGFVCLKKCENCIICCERLIAPQENYNNIQEKHND